MQGTAASLRRRAAWVALAALLLAGCAIPPPRPFSFVTSDPAAVRPRILKAAVEAESCFTENLITVSLRPPWKVRLADTAGAVTRALESVPGANVLTDVVVRTRIEQYLLFQRVCAVVFGDAGKIE